MHKSESFGEAGLNRRGFLIRSTAIAATAIGGDAAHGQKQQQRGGDGAAEGSKTMVGVAMLSGWHAHAKEYGKAVAEMPDAKVAVVWDENPDRGKAWAEELGAPFVANLDEVLARDDVDAVVCDAPSNMHADIMTAAANAGKHIFTEKVMALTIEECNRISDAVRKANVKFCISFPSRTRPDVLYAHQAVQDGLLGEMTFFRVRVAHNAGSANWLPPHFWDPVQTGGGAMMDLGAHPMYIARWLGGQPKKISSTFTFHTGHEVEDNAVSVIEFESKCIGVCETSFMSTNSPFSLEISGTEGGLFVGGPLDKVFVRSNKAGHQDWVTPETLPEAPPKAIQMWMDAIRNDTPTPFGLEDGTQLTELMQYAYVAFREGRQVEIPRR